MLSLESYAELLQSKAAELTSLAKAARNAVAIEPSADEIDLIVSRTEHEQAAEACNNSARTLAQIRDALRRIKTGEFGKCSKCGADIETRRLQAVPWATKCIDCAGAWWDNDRYSATNLILSSSPNHSLPHQQALTLNQQRRKEAREAEAFRRMYGRTVWA